MWRNLPPGQQIMEFSPGRLYVQAVVQQQLGLKSKLGFIWNSSIFTNLFVSFYWREVNEESIKIILSCRRRTLCQLIKTFEVAGNKTFNRKFKCRIQSVLKKMDRKETRGYGILYYSLKD